MTTITDKEATVEVHRTERSTQYSQTALTVTALGGRIESIPSYVQVVFDQNETRNGRTDHEYIVMSLDDLEEIVKKARAVRRQAVADARR